MSDEWLSGDVWDLLIHAHCAWLDRDWWFVRIGGGVMLDSETQDVQVCELCGEECEYLVGCAKCGKMVGPCCVAAFPDDEQTDESICEECF